MFRSALPTIFLLCVAFALASCMRETRAQQVRQPSSSPPELSGDGRYFGYVKDGTPEPPAIGFDIAQTYSGDAANKAAAEDGFVKPGEPVSNDHYERNPVRRVESLKLDSSAQVTAAWPASFLMRFVTPKQQAKCEAETGAPPCLHVPIGLPVFFGAVRELDPRQGIPAWVTVRDGVVVRIDEQYFP